MWGEIWGELAWGGALSVPMLAPWVLGLLAASLVAFGARAIRARRPGARLGRLGVLSVLVLGVGVAMTARAVTLPFVFTNGTVADAEEVNDNFQALSDAVDAGPLVYVDANFQNDALAGGPGITAAKLVLPPGSYLLQAKVRFRNNGASDQDASCSFLQTSGLGVGSLDAAVERIPPGATVGGFLMSDVVVPSGGALTVNLQCFGSVDVSVINSQFIAMPAVFSIQ